MPLPDAPATTARPVDAVALARWRRRLRDAPEPPWLHAEAARRMADRLGVVRLQPERIVSWGLQPMLDQSLLAAAYPKARVWSVDPDGLARPATLAPWWRSLWPRTAPVESFAPDTVPPGQAQLVWSVMSLHTAVDPQAAFVAWHRALAVDGFLMFCTVGPGTLSSLAHRWAGQGFGPALAPLVDMHDLGDMLVQAGFADPVMDQETLRLTWDSAGAALAELRSLGLNATPARHAGLRTPRWREQLPQALETLRGPDGRIVLEFELVYGHAFKPLPRARVASETTVALDDLRTMARRPGTTPRR